MRLAECLYFSLVDLVSLESSLIDVKSDCATTIVGCTFAEIDIDGVRRSGPGSAPGAVISQKVSDSTILLRSSPKWKYTPIRRTASLVLHVFFR